MLITFDIDRTLAQVNEDNPYDENYWDTAPLLDPRIPTVLNTLRVCGYGNVIGLLTARPKAPYTWIKNSFGKEWWDFFQVVGFGVPTHQKAQWLKSHNVNMHFDDRYEVYHGAPLISIWHWSTRKTSHEKWDALERSLIRLVPGYQPSLWLGAREEHNKWLINSQPQNIILPEPLLTMQMSRQ